MVIKIRVKHRNGGEETIIHKGNVVVTNALAGIFGFELEKPVYSDTSVQIASYHPTRIEKIDVDIGVINNQLNKKDEEAIIQALLSIPIRNTTHFIHIVATRDALYIVHRNKVMKITHQ